VARIRAFEIAGVYLRDAAMQDGPLTVAGYREPKRVAAIAYGALAEEQWGQPSRNADYFDIKGDLDALFAPAALRFAKATHPALHPGRSARVLLEGQDIGFIGELHPALQQKYDLPLAPVLFEVDAQALQRRKVPVYADISRFPAVTRDLALVVKQGVAVQDLLDAMTAEKHRNPACAILQAIVLFDEYHGKGLQDDEKSLAFRCTLQDTQNTLQDDAVEHVISTLVAIASAQLGAKLRA
jgi:phenylalanyl-tRNA synthetase beta chain